MASYLTILPEVGLGHHGKGEGERGGRGRSLEIFADRECHPKPLVESLLPPTHSQMHTRDSLPTTALTDQAHSVEQNACEGWKFIQNSKILELCLNCRALWKQPMQTREKPELPRKSKPVFSGRSVNILGRALVRLVSKPHRVCEETLTKTAGRFQFGQLWPLAIPCPFLNPPLTSCSLSLKNPAYSFCSWDNSNTFPYLRCLSSSPPLS